MFFQLFFQCFQISAGELVHLTGRAQERSRLTERRRADFKHSNGHKIMDHMLR